MFVDLTGTMNIPEDAVKQHGNLIEKFNVCSKYYKRKSELPHVNFDQTSVAHLNLVNLLISVSQQTECPPL